MSDHATVLDALPPPLDEATIVALNRPKGDLHTTREYVWNDLAFEVPPDVFKPGLTSAMIFDRVLSGEIETRGRRYLAMGCGLGVEAVAAGLRRDGGPGHTWAVDVHRPSVRAAVANHDRLIGDGGCTGVVADVLDGIDDDVTADVVTFNPPAVSRRVSDDADVVRNVCEGAPLLERFFAQLASRQLLAPDGEVFVIVSNTADLRAIAGHGVEHGFMCEVAHRHDWNDGVLTYLFRFSC